MDFDALLEYGAPEPGAVAAAAALELERKLKPAKKRAPKRKADEPLVPSDAIQLPPVLALHELTLGGQKKSADATVFRATYPDSEQLGSALAALRAVLGEIELAFQRESGLTVCGLSDNHVTYVLLRVPRASFLAYHFDEAGPSMTAITVRAQQFFVARNKFDADKTMTFCRVLDSEASERMCVQIHPAYQRNRAGQSWLLQIPETVVEVERFGDLEPRTMYQFRATMTCATFTKLVHDFRADCSDIAFKLSSAGFEAMGAQEFEGGESRTRINYTASTRKDAALTGYDVFDEAALLPQSERDMFAELDAGGTAVRLCHLDRLVRREAVCEHVACVMHEGAPTCVRALGPDEGGTARMSLIDTIRFRLRFLDEAASMVQDCDYVELFLGRMAPPRDEHFCPLLIRARSLDEAQTRASMTRMVYLSPKADDK